MSKSNVRALPVPETEAYLTRQELASFLKVSPNTISVWTGQGMPAERWGRRTRRYKKSLVVAWLRERGSWAA